MIVGPCRFPERDHTEGVYDSSKQGHGEPDIMNE